VVGALPWTLCALTATQSWREEAQVPQARACKMTEGFCNR
jgi:hypothetical protein